MTFFVEVQVVGRGELAVLADGALCPADAGGVHDRAQRAELGGGVDGGLNLAGVGDVDGNELAADLSGDLLAVLSLQIRDDDLGALLGEATGRRCTDAGGTAGDDCTCSLDIHTGEDTRVCDDRHARVGYLQVTFGSGSYFTVRVCREMTLPVLASVMMRVFDVVNPRLPFDGIQSSPLAGPASADR